MLNRVVLMGRLTAAPELRYTPNNVAVTDFTLAVNRDYAKQGTERQTDFIDIVAWRSTAEFASKYFNKGQLVAVEGSIRIEPYTDKEGNKRRSFRVVADNVYFAESKRDSANNANSFNNKEADSKNESVSFSNGDTADFEEVPTDDDLPF